MHDIITACGGNVSKIEVAIAAGVFGIVSAAGLTEGPDQPAAHSEGM